MNQQVSLPQAEEIHLQDYINVIVRRRYTFVSVFAAVVVCVVLYVFLATPSYLSTATLFVKDEKGKVGQMGDLLLNAATPIDSEVEILKSRSNAERVVEKLHLNWNVSKKSRGTSVKVLEFATSASNIDEPEYDIELTGAGSYIVKHEGREVGRGTSGEVLRGKTLTLRLTDLKGKKGDSFTLTLAPFNTTVENLQKQIKVQEVGKKTNVMSVSYRDKDPQLAKDVVNTLVQVYLDQGVVLRAQEATLTVGFVEEQLKLVKAELEQAEKNLAAYKSSSGVVQLDAEAQNLIKNLSEAEQHRAQTSLQRKQAEFALASLSESRRRGVPYSPAVLREDPVLAGMATKLAELEVQKKGLLSESTASHPGVKSVQAQIDELQKKIQGTYETTLRNTQKQERDIASDIAMHDFQLKKLPVAERELARLTRVAKVNADIFTFLLQKHEEARIARASTINNISVIDPAIAADRPVFPKKMKTLLVGLMLGLMCGIGACFLREYLDDTLKDPEQTMRVLSLPMLGVIPFIPAKNGSEATITHDSPKSPASEAFRTLRTGLHFSGVNWERKVMLVTSSFPGEGKSTVVANLAITLAQTGARVLVLDCDLRRSTLHEKLGLQRGEGLTERLAGDITTEKALHATSIEGLHLLKSGAVPPNPSEMLGSQSMRQLVDELKGMFTHIVIDAPPVLAVTDAAVLTQYADQVLVVLEAGRVPVKAAQRTRDHLAAAAAPVAGVVISDKNSKLSGYGYGYGYCYGYGAGKDEKTRWLPFRKG